MHPKDKLKAAIEDLRTKLANYEAEMEVNNVSDHSPPSELVNYSDTDRLHDEMVAYERLYHEGQAAS